MFCNFWVKLIKKENKFHKKKKLRGPKDQLLIGKMILIKRKRRLSRLGRAWKAYKGIQKGIWQDDLPQLGEEMHVWGYREYANGAS